MTLDECSYIIEMARSKMDRSTIAEASETEAKNGVVRAVAVCCSVLQRVVACCILEKARYKMDRGTVVEASETEPKMSYYVRL